MHLWVIEKNWVIRSSEMQRLGTKWLICCFYWSQFITNIYTVVTLQNQRWEVCFNEWRKRVKTFYLLLNPVNTLLLPSGSIRQIRSSDYRRPHIPISNHDQVWWALLMQHSHQRTCASFSVWSDPHWRRCLVTLSLLPLGVLCCPVRPGGRPRWLCEGHLWRRWLTGASGSCLMLRRSVPSLELHRPSVAISVCVVLHLTLSSSDY